MNRPLRALVVALAIVGIVAIACATTFVLGGIAADRTPSKTEARLARAARHYLIPSTAHERANPTAVDRRTLEEARRHWADHCASCHGNDGRGHTAIGSGLYPPAPDMTLAATQDLSDGELYWIIEHGIRLTGMPGWGTEASAEDGESWALVHFIRHLPVLTADELEEMERFNPISREALDRQLAIERFLSDETGAAPQHEPHEHQSLSEGS